MSDTEQQITQEDDNSWREVDNIIDVNRHLLVTGRDFDCTFVFTGTEEEFRCHKYILRSRSLVFENMFFGDLAIDGNEVKIDDIRPNIFRKMLEYIYTDEVELEWVETARDLYCAAQKYRISSLTRVCHDFIKVNIISADVCSMLEFSLKIDGAQDLKESCIKLLQYNTDEILKSQNFLNAKTATIQTLLKQEKLYLPDGEELLFRACARWANHRASNSSTYTPRDYLKPVLHLFRFKTMSSAQFAKTICNTNILTPQEENGILMSYAKISDMPNGFSNVAVRRDFYFIP